MKKDKEWLKEEVFELYVSPDYETVAKTETISKVLELINQLDEPEVKQLDKKIKELESYNDELIRDNNQLRITLDNQEVLSQEWIENHSASADTISYYSKDNVPVVTAFNLKGLLMPKQEEIDRAHKDGYEKGKESEKPVEAVKEYFKSVEKSKEVLEELGYVVSEKPQKPMLPQFVANWIESYTKKTLVELINDAVYSSDEDSKCFRRWFHEEMGFESNYSEFLARAWLDGYEVEKEPVYFAKIKGHELVETETILDDDTGNDVSEFYRNVYFVLQRNGELVIDMKDNGLSGAKNVMTMNQWNDLGINETNADFEEVME